MPASASSASASRPTDLVARLGSGDREVRLRALREVKNQIIGNRTKKLAYVKLGAVPAVASALAEDSESVDNSSLLVQSAAALGSFACGVDAGVRAVLDAGALPHLFRLLSYPNDKVVDSGARSLRMIYQSKLAPKYDFAQQRNVEFLISLLNSDNENVSGLGASIITHSCETSLEQKTLWDAGVVKKLIDTLEDSPSQKDSSLESLVTIIKNNSEIISRFLEFESGRALTRISDLAKDRVPRTRLLACMCLIIIRNNSCYLQDIGTKTKLVYYLLKLLEEPGQVGDEACFAFSSLIEEKEDLQKLAFEANAVEKISLLLQKGAMDPKRLQGILLALANLCSKLEVCRSKLLSVQAFDSINDTLSNDCSDVSIAACLCFKNVSRSVQNLTAGHFINETSVISLLRLLQDPATSVQVAALGAISNVLVEFTGHRLTFIKHGGVKHLVRMLKSVDSCVRSNSLWALKNLTFHADNRCKRDVFEEITASSLANLIHDPNSRVQEQALALVRNLVDGSLDSIDYVFAEGNIILDAVGRRLQQVVKAETATQGMYVLCNVASGNPTHKDAVMKQLLPQLGTSVQPFMIKFMQSNDSRLRTASVWVLVNLIISPYAGASERLSQLRSAGIISQLNNMVNDSCVDVKLRVRMALGQCMILDDGSL